YEITVPGGSVEYFNEEPGAQWMERIRTHFDRMVWLNPIPKDRWGYVPSISMTQQLIGQQMFPLTLQGINEAILALKKPA
ncbi:MAG: VWA domain-containing protein, partial [Pseudomonadota bacterium]